VLCTQYKDGLSHGKGKLILDGEGQYEGEFFEGKKHGRGVWTGPDDILYDGQYQNDRRHGETDAESERRMLECTCAGIHAMYILTHFRESELAFLCFVRKPKGAIRLGV
jgi:hypothetical protein